jgi:signal transduction histidine kinase
LLEIWGNNGMKAADMAQPLVTSDAISGEPALEEAEPIFSILPRKTVLIVDDEKRMADSLRDLLAPAGYTVEVAYNGAQAIDLLRQRFYHVLVTDLRMQGIGGLDIIRYAHEHHARTLIIVITGHATTESAIEAVHYNVFDFLRKPFEFDLLRMAIEKAFHKIETDQLREDTAAMITHDIKVPLTSIIGFASMIHDPASGQIHSNAVEFAETIKANGQKILELIENYLTSCRIDSGTLSITPVTVNPCQFLADVVELAQIEARRQQRTIQSYCDPSLPEHIYMDEALVFRAMENLLQNAIKYSLGRGPIELRAERLAPAESPLCQNTLRLRVINDADEIMAGQLANGFDRYARGNYHVGIPGSGLGLYIVRAVSHAHDGLASAEWLDQGRVSFQMLLPLIIKSETGT